MYISRITLRNDSSNKPVIARRLSSNQTEQRFLWRLAGEPDDNQRDFIYRVDLTKAALEFVVLSARPLLAPNEPWEFESKKYQPEFRVGQKLRFQLRISPTVDLYQGPQQRSARKDIIRLRHEERREQTSLDDTINLAVNEWLAPKSGPSGFKLLETSGSRYHIAFAELKKNPLRIPVVDIEGLIEITDPLGFYAAQCRGFGKLKFFGLGLMTVTDLAS